MLSIRPSAPGTAFLSARFQQVLFTGAWVYGGGGGLIRLPPRHCLGMVAVRHSVLFGDDVMLTYRSPETWSLSLV